MKSQYFTQEHEIFRNSVRQFIQKEVIPHTEAWEKAREIPRSVWKRMGELGFLGISYPERFGGSDADFFFSVVFLEELALSGMGGFSTAVSVHQYMATAHIASAGSDELKQKYLVPAIKGEKIGALAVTEPGAGSDVSAIRTKAVRDGDEYVINGSKIFISNGVYGDFVTLACKTNSEAGAGGISLIVVDTNAPGFKASKLEKMGLHSSDTAEISFDNVRVPASNLIGQENSGFYYIMESFQLERLVAAIISCSGMVGCLDMTMRYLNEREAFNRPLAKFQVIRHTMADLASQVEAARQLTYHTCWLHAEGSVATRECSMAKLYATELAKKVADECLQFFGGYGYMDEYPISRMYRDTRVGTIAGGASAIMREIIAKMMFDQIQYQSAYQADQATPAKESAPRKAEASQKTEAPVTPAKPASSAVPDTTTALFDILPKRFQPEKAKTATMTVHFKISGEKGGEHTVIVDQGKCSVQHGLQGESKCLVETDAQTYLDVELGKMEAAMAFMTGKIKVNNLQAMMQFVTWFSPVTPDMFSTQSTTPVQATSTASVSATATPAPATTGTGTLDELFQGLPSRLKTEKSSGVNMIVHFNLSGALSGKYTVAVKNGECHTQQGHEGEPKCVVEVEGQTYLDIENGKLEPQMAFMSGKLKVSNIGAMMQFASLFRKIQG
ncbi:MAG: acyl-CoA dehydrogenase family protein [SAR324 cluster bacterium]|nr:acyl-CoA dehydrogenase family protein [SAR324 cluster bacterium]